MSLGNDWVKSGNSNLWKREASRIYELVLYCVRRLREIHVRVEYAMMISLLLRLEGIHCSYEKR